MTVNRGIFIGIGSNMGDRVEHCRESIERVRNDGRAAVREVSSFYLTSPVSAIPQDDFINCAVALEWAGSPEDLLSFLNKVEGDMGRVRGIPDGPRPIDLDILLFGDVILSTPSLTIPHAELHRRKFALLPCLEIDPSLVHPLYLKPLASFVEGLDESQKISLHEPYKDRGKNMIEKGKRSGRTD